MNINISKIIFIQTPEEYVVPILYTIPDDPNFYRIVDLVNGSNGSLNYSLSTTYPGITVLSNTGIELITNSMDAELYSYQDVTENLSSDYTYLVSIYNQLSTPTVTNTNSVPVPQEQVHEEPSIQVQPTPTTEVLISEALATAEYNPDTVVDLRYSLGNDNNTNPTQTAPSQQPSQESSPNKTTLENNQVETEVYSNESSIEDMGNTIIFKSDTYNNTLINANFILNGNIELQLDKSLTVKFLE